MTLWRHLSWEDLNLKIYELHQSLWRSWVANSTTHDRQGGAGGQGS